MFQGILRLLVEACVLAYRHGVGDKIQPTEEAVMQLLPETESFAIAIAMAQLENKDHTQAIERMERLLGENSSDDYIKSVLCFIQQVSAVDGWQESYQAILATSTDERARRVVQQGLSI